MNVKNVNDLEFNTDELQEETGKKVKREIEGNQQNITYVNDYIRFITVGDGDRKIEELTKYKDGTDNWNERGWYGKNNDGAMFRRIICLVRDNKLKQQQVSDLKYYIKCFEDAEAEITKYFRVEF